MSKPQRSRGGFQSDNVQAFNRHPISAQRSRQLPSVKPLLARRGPVFIGGIAVYSFAAYGTYLYLVSSKTGTEGLKLNIPEDVSDRYHKSAKNFDKEVDLAEKLMGLGWLRQNLIKQASGHVLEVSVGTGRNSQYYDLKKCRSLTMVDQSAEMIEIAKQKLKGIRCKDLRCQLHSSIVERILITGADTYPDYKTCRFLTQSAHDPIPCPSPAGYDTVIQTMGLCSTPNASLLLANLGQLTNPKTGRILLLEHGRSYFAWLNRILDNHAPAHADKHGCWWNKDIQKIVEDSGLEVIKIKRYMYHFGTTWRVELRPRAA